MIMWSYFNMLNGGGIMNIQICKESETKTAVITLSGEITVEDASELCSALKEIANEEMDTTVEVEGVERADVTFFQLICSAHRTFTAKNKQFIIKTGKNDLLAKGSESGFVRHKGCTRDKFCTCAMVMEK
jgi:ABC-type transporter Mla MlaB component